MLRVLTILAALLFTIPAFAAQRPLTTPDTPAKGDLGTAYSWLYAHDYERAVLLADSALKKGLSNSDSALAYTYRGQANLKLKKTDMAIADFTKAVSLDKTLVDAVGNRAMAYADKGQFDKAVADFSQVLKTKGSMPEWWSNRGGAYLKMKDADKAIGDYTHAIGLKKTGPYYTARGRAYLLKKDNDKAIADFDAALKIRENDSFALYGRGLAKRAKGDAAGAAADIAQAKRYNTNIEKQMAEG